jgi:hypothetical protein
MRTLRLVSISQGATQKIIHVCRRRLCFFDIYFYSTILSAFSLIQQGSRGPPMSSLIQLLRRSYRGGGDTAIISIVRAEVRGLSGSRSKFFCAEFECAGGAGAAKPLPESGHGRKTFLFGTDGVNMMKSSNVSRLIRSVDDSSDAVSGSESGSDSCKNMTECLRTRFEGLSQSGPSSMSVSRLGADASLSDEKEKQSDWSPTEQRTFSELALPFLSLPSSRRSRHFSLETNILR